MPTYTSQYPPEYTSTYCKETTDAGGNYEARWLFNPGTSLTGAFTQCSWLSVILTITNQRVHVDLGSAKIIKRIYYENLHHWGANTNRGVQNFTFWGSNTGAGTFDDLVYANDEGWTELTVSQNTLDEHVALDQADPKYITVTNTTAYRYYAFKCADNYGDTDHIGIRRVELQTEANAIFFGANF